MSIPSPSGSPWWLAYDDGCVWPCELLGAGVWPGQWRVRPLHPAPDAGEERLEPRGRIYDSQFNHPGATRLERRSRRDELADLRDLEGA